MTQIENFDEEINIETSNQTIVSQTVIEIDMNRLDFCQNFFFSNLVKKSRQKVTKIKN